MLSFIATFWTDFDEFAIFGIHITLSNELYMDVCSVSINFLSVTSNYRVI
jgi:hypothetical protein